MISKTEETVSYKEFVGDIAKNKISGTVFIFGAENFLINWATKEIVNKFISENERTLNVKEFYGEDSETKAPRILSEASTYSMFGGNRVVIVHNYPALFKKVDAATDFENKKILEFAGSGQDSTILVFTLDREHNKGTTSFKKNLIKAAKSYEMAKLDRRTVRGFISKRLKAAGKFMDSRDLERFIDMTGYFYRDSEYSLNEMSKDIEKLIRNTEGTTIAGDTFEDLMTGEEDKFIFNLVDSLMNGKNEKALNMFLNIIASDKDAAMNTIGLLTKQFEMMYDSLELDETGMSLKSMAKELKVNEYRLTKAYKSARQFRKNRLQDILIKIYNLDRDIKRGDIAANIGLELLLMDI